VGVGQSEVEVAAAADTTLVLLAPGMGDGIQAAKAGILEVGDIFVVNKADRDGADSTVRELRNMTALGDRAAGGWVPPVLKTVASTQVGITELVEAIDRHAAWLTESGELDVRRVKRARDEVEAIALGMLKRRMETGHRSVRFEQAAADVAVGRADAYSAADMLVNDLLDGSP
jgi:LAO/AO transport system kinase